MRVTHLFLTIVLLVSACSTQQVQVQPAANLKTIGSGLALDIRGKDIDPAVIDELTRHLKAKLIIAGFDIDTSSTRSLQLRVDVHAFNPGNQGLRLTVGFGAGRGALFYTARYIDRAGQTLAEMEAQEYFTGSEVHFNTQYGPVTTLGGPDTVQNVLVQEAATHIVELARGEKKK